MSEFSLSSTKKSGLPSFILSDLYHLCFFVFSHPLYFSYFIFFSPYLFKIFSFLSPLFITTTLLLLAFLSTVSPGLVQDDSHHDSSDPMLGSLAAMYQTVSERLRSKADNNENDGGDKEEFQRFDEFEVYKIVFETLAFEIREDPFEVLEEVVKETCSEASQKPVDKCLIHEDHNNAAADDHDMSKGGSNGDSEEKPAEISEGIMEFEKPMVGPIESLKWCLQEEGELENMSCKKEDKEDTQVKPWNTDAVESENVDQDHKQQLFTRSGSKVSVDNYKIKDIGRVASREYFASPDRDFDRQYSWKSNTEECQSTCDSSLGSFGSMRKEKEWRRTLACKLFEERHNANGGEGMDLLWETYETSESKKAQSRSNSKKGKKSVAENSDVDEDDEYEDEAEGQLCCLQALKFSAGKMNLGMGRPNLVKISKALKGIGWITHVGRHGKKRYN